MSRRESNDSEPNVCYVDRYNPCDAIYAIVQGCAIVGVLFVFLLAVWFARGGYNHWYEVQGSCYRRAEPEYALKQRLVSSFCDSNPVHDRATECVAARDYLRTSINHRVFDMVMNEYWLMVPGVAYCTHTSDCRSYLFGLNESLKSSVWYVMLILATSVGIALVVAVKIILANCCRVNREAYRRSHAALPLTMQMDRSYQKKAQ